MSEFTDIQMIAQRQMELAKGKNMLHAASEAMVRGDYDLPSEVPDHVRQALFTVVSTDPHDAVRAAQRSLTNTRPEFSIAPLHTNRETRQKFDEWEAAIKWLWELATRRPGVKTTEDINWNSVLYGEVAGRVVFLDHEIEARKMFKGDTRRLEMARQYGSFVVDNMNPKNVFPRFSDWMLEGVLTKSTDLAVNTISFWGDLAEPLKRQYDKEHERYNWVTTFDYQTPEERWVWCILHPNSDDQIMPFFQEAKKDGEILLMEGEDTGLNFLPFYYSATGNSTMPDERDRVLPMLKSIIDSGQWEASNLLDTLTLSKSLHLFWRAVLAEEGFNPAKTQFNTSDPANIIAKVPSGNTLRPLQFETLDQGMLLLADRFSNRMDKSTVSRLLQTGEFPSGTPVGAVNIITQSATQAIEPYRHNTERAMAQIAQIILRWIKHSDKPFVVDAVPMGEGSRQITIKPDEIDPQFLYVECHLKDAEPIDLVTKANTANMLIEQGYPKARAWEQIGIADPYQAQKEAWSDQIFEVIYGNELAKLQASAQAEIQAMMAQMQMQVQQQMAQQAQQQGQAGMSGVGGPGFDPASGGQSPLAANPGATFEGSNGTTRNGVPL